MEKVDDHYSVDDINQIESGLGDKICKMLDEVQGYHSLCEAGTKIRLLLAAYGIDGKEVIIDRGKAAGLTVDNAIEVAAKSFQFRDQFDG